MAAAPQRPHRLVSLSLLAVLVMVLAASPASARIIGLLFDDSGSMAPYSHLPAFGAQLLVSTLDGRDGRDRLISARLSQFVNRFGGSRNIAAPVASDQINADTVVTLLKAQPSGLSTDHPMTTSAQQQAIIDEIAGSWPNIEPEMPTPYQPVEILLHSLAERTKPDEDAFLVIISDGEFSVRDRSHAVPPPDQLRRSYEAYKARFHGRLRVFFLLIDAQDGRITKTVENQKVRSTLLEVFNGDARDGSYNVSNFETLYSAMKEIIARISATDLADNSPVVTASGPRIEMRTPFAISRIISLSTASEPGVLPALTAASFPHAEKIDLSAAMRRKDTQWAGNRQKARTTHLRLHPALPPGTYSLDYDAAVANRVSLLFETNVVLNLEVLDAAGQPVALNPAGALVLQLGRQYTVVARVADQAGSGIRPVDPTKLPSQTLFTASVSGPGGAQTLRLTPQVLPSGAAAPLTLNQAGTYRLHGVMRLPGFVTSYSLPRPVVVVDTLATLALTAERTEPCPGACDPGDLPTIVTGQNKPVRLASLEARYEAAREGILRIALEAPPAGIYLAHPDGRPLDPQAPLSVRPGDAVKLALFRGLGWAPAGGPDPLQGQTVEVRATALPPMEGQAVLTLQIKPQIPPAQLVARGHSQDPDGRQPLIVGIRDLAEQINVFDFHLNGAVRAPIPQDFTITGGGPLIDFDVTVDDFKVAISPRSAWWCRCLLFLDSGVRKLSIQYRGLQGLQTASAIASLDIQPSIREVVISCLKSVSLLLFLVWLIGAAIAAHRSHRFPRGSFLKIEEGRDLPRYRPLRGRNWTVLRALLWIPFGVPHERRHEVGVLLEATPEGADLIGQHHQKWPDFQLVRLGQTLEEVAPGIEHNRRIRLFWNDELTEGGHNGPRLSLMRSLLETE